MDRIIAIAIDGPAAAGKSTVAKKVAEKLAYIYIDTGAMYRALTLEAIRKKIDLNDETSLENILNNMSLKLEHTENGQRVIVNGADVTSKIRSQQVTNSVSHIAKHRNIRKEMVQRQQALAKEQNIVMDGRDIGTHVLPNADVKFFLIATVEERAKRRYEENLKSGIPTSLHELKQEIKKRDQMDTKRDVSPLIKASDAIELDTTELTIDDVVSRILTEVKKVNQT